MLERHLSIALVLSLCLIPAAGFLAIGRLSCANFHSRSIRTPLELHVEKSSQPQDAKQNKRNKRRQRNKKLTHAEKLSNRLYLGGLDLVVDEKALMVMCKERGVDPFAVEFHAPADGKKGYAWLTFPDVPTAAGAIVLLDGIFETVEFSRSVVLEEGDLKTWESSRSVDPFRASARIGAVLESLSAGSDSEKKTKEGDSQLVTNLEEALKELLAAERVAEKTRTELDGLLKEKAQRAEKRTKGPEQPKESQSEMLDLQEEKTVSKSTKAPESTFVTQGEYLATQPVSQITKSGLSSRRGLLEQLEESQSGKVDLQKDKTDLVSKITKGPESTFATQPVSQITKTGLSNRQGLTTAKSLKSKTNAEEPVVDEKEAEEPVVAKKEAEEPVVDENEDEEPGPVVPLMDRREIDLGGSAMLSRKLLANELRMRTVHVALNRLGAPKESKFMLKERLQAACGGASVIRKMTDGHDEIPDDAVADFRSGLRRT